MKITEITENTQGVSEAVGLYGPFTVTINTGERPQSRTKTKKFRREDDAILWAQDWLEDFSQYVFATAEVTDPEGNVVWTTDESLEEQGVAEGQLDPYRLERLDPQSRRVLQRMADHAEPGSWLSASEAYAIMLGLQHKRQDPRGWEQEVQGYVDLWNEITGKK